MALILGLHPKSVFYINDTPVTVLRTEGHKLITLDVKGKQYEVTDQASEEIFPGVFVSCGVPKATKDGGFPLMPRLVIEAPREIVILREELYLKRKHVA